jgi:uncharacterized Zn-binding protein involved in type VI secretion
MATVSINPPKTPVTAGSDGIAPATTPNVCKMPGPPAPFVPAPLPNVGRSGLSPEGYSKSVLIEGKRVAVKGATFGSVGDIASKATGGGVVSAAAEGATAFVGPGSMDVKIEGKNVQLLGDPMLNNGGPGGSPPNAATMVGVVQDSMLTAVQGDEPCALCSSSHGVEGMLRESAATQADAQHVWNLARRAVDQASASSAKPVKWQKMLGVVHGRDGRVYVANSGLMLRELRDLISRQWHAPVACESLDGWRAPPGTRAGRDAFVRHFQNKHAFRRAWDMAARGEFEEATGTVRARPGTHFPPGTCAAQQAALLAMDHGTRPLSMTERHFVSRPVEKKPDGSAPELPMRVRQGGPEAPVVEVNYYNSPDAVPPCRTCEVMMNVLMCTTDKDDVEAGGCTCW